MKYVDLKQLSLERSDVLWIMKDYESSVPYHAKYKNKDFIKSALLKSVEFQYDLKIISDKTGWPMSKLLKDAEEIIDGMAHNLGMNSVRLMGVLLSKLLKALFEGVYIDELGIETIRKAYTKGPIVLLPTHRSYVDFLLMSYVMFNWDLPLPVIAAAMDFMNMKFVGELLRNCGAFFIKRSFASDELYWAVFSRYVKLLISLAQEPLEFFIEGTRSRTNKSLYPKMGMLGITFESWLTSSSDLTFIPVSISYERVLEEKLYAWELLGVPKPKETTKSLLKVRHILNENYGKVYFTVGNPLSLKDITLSFGDINKFTHNLQLRFKPNLFEQEKLFLKYLSKLIVESQQKCMVVPDGAIVSLIMNYHHIKQPNIHLDDVVCYFSKILNLIPVHLTYNEPVHLTHVERVRRTLEIHNNIFTVHENDTVSFRTENETNELTPPVDTITDQYIAARLMLSNYLNPILFHLARESIILSIIGLSNSNNLAIDQLGIISEFKLIMKLIQRELIYSGSEELNFQMASQRLESVQDDVKCKSLIQWALLPYLVSYFVYFSLCQNEISQLKAFDVKSLHAAVLQLVRSNSSNPIVKSILIESVSTDRIKNFFSVRKELVGNCMTEKVMILLKQILRSCGYGEIEKILDNVK